jgi:hypothetical protein
MKLEELNLPTCSSCKKFTFVDANECINCGNSHPLKQKRNYAAVLAIISALFLLIVWSFWETFKS